MSYQPHNLGSSLLSSRVIPRSPPRLSDNQFHMSRRKEAMVKENSRPASIEQCGRVAFDPAALRRQKGAPKVPCVRVYWGRRTNQVRKCQANVRLRGSLRHFDHHHTIIKDMAKGSRAAIEHWPLRRRCLRRSCRQQFHYDQLTASTIIRKTSGHTPVHHHV